MKIFLQVILLTGSIALVAAVWGTDDPHSKTSIAFSQSRWQELLTLAKAENKVIFVDIYATWCGPCKLLKKTTFMNDEVGDFFNSHFINAAFDGEKPEGRLLVQQYGVHSYPTMLFINPDGTIRETAIGYHTSSQLLKRATQVLKIDYP